MSLIGHVDAKLAHRRMIQKEPAEGLVIFALDHFAHISLIADRYRFAAAGTMEREPAPAGLQPAANEIVLLIIGIRPRDVGEEEVAAGEPLRYFGVVVADSRQHLRVLLQHAEQSQPYVIHVMAGERPGRVAADDKMDANRFGAAHRTTLWSRRNLACASR